jgi:hypothetical protein
MTYAAHLYDNFQAGMIAGKINPSSDTLNIALCTSSYTPNQGSDTFWSTPQANEVSGTGYTAGGQALTSTSWTLNTGTNVWTYTAANPQWSGATLTAAKAVVYDVTSGAAASSRYLVGWIDFGGNVSPSNQTLIITPNASGLFTFTYS